MDFYNKNIYNSAMIKNIFLIVICILIISIILGMGAYAKGNNEKSNFLLMQQAIEYAAKADVYNAYCNKTSTMAEDFLSKFKQDQNISSSERNILLELKNKYKQEAKIKLDKEKHSCKSLDFMMQHFEIMRKLKDISYLLNGVDPSTLPQQNIPDIESLLPPRRSISL